MKSVNYTRGYGILEGFLSRKRAQMAEKHMPESLLTGKILDIGCGLYPYLLLYVDALEKYGIDKIAYDDKKLCNKNIFIRNQDIESDENIPYDSNYFDVVTMLAVVEHIDPSHLVGILMDIRRVLKPDGVFIMTTPAAWTDRLLRIMARLKIVSAEEIKEHKDYYDHSKLCLILQKAGFNRDKVNFGYFEFFMNLWVVARK